MTKLNMLWPGFLILLPGIPLVTWLYLRLLRRRRKYAIRYSSLSLVRPALIRPSPWRRYLPPALFLLAQASLVVSLSRPVAMVASQAKQSTIMLAIDVSASMLSDDVAPTRIQAAQSAALAFIALQKGNTRIGLVVFSDGAYLVTPPTTDHEKLNTAVQTLTTGSNTAMGSGILESLKAISEDRKANQVPGEQKVPLEGKDAPEAIILLTDGYNTVGPEPVLAAQEAANQGVRVYTIGIGSPPSIAVNATPTAGQQLQIPATGGPGSYSPGPDAVTLQKIAKMTGGNYYAPEDAGGLEKIFTRLSLILTRQSEPQEISVVFVALGALIACAAILLSQLWNPLL